MPTRISSNQGSAHRGSLLYEDNIPDHNASMSSSSTVRRRCCFGRPTPTSFSSASPPSTVFVTTRTDRSGAHRRRIEWRLRRAVAAHSVCRGYRQRHRCSVRIRRALWLRGFTPTFGRSAAGPAGSKRVRSRGSCAYVRIRAAIFDLPGVRLEPDPRARPALACRRGNFFLRRSRARLPTPSLHSLRSIPDRVSARCQDESRLFVRS